MEEFSEWLIDQDNSVTTVGAYLTNPMRLFVKDRQIGIINPVAGTFEFYYRSYKGKGFRSCIPFVS